MKVKFKKKTLKITFFWGGCAFSREKFKVYRKK